MLIQIQLSLLLACPLTRELPCVAMSLTHAAFSDIRSLDKEGQWTKFADTPIIEKAGGTKRAAAEPVVKFEGDVRALKQWRGDLVTKCDEAKAAYQKALGATSFVAICALSVVRTDAPSLLPSYCARQATSRPGGQSCRRRRRGNPSPLALHRSSQRR